jgi:hypothetical protein
MNNAHTALEVGVWMSCCKAAALVVLIVSFYLINKISHSVSFNLFHSSTASMRSTAIFLVYRLLVLVTLDHAYVNTTSSSQGWLPGPGTIFAWRRFQMPLVSANVAAA